MISFFLYFCDQQYLAFAARIHELLMFILFMSNCIGMYDSILRPTNSHHNKKLQKIVDSSMDHK